MGEVEKHVWCDCKSKSWHKNKDFFRFWKKEETDKGNAKGEGGEEVKESMDKTTVENNVVEGTNNDLRKTEAKGGFFWNAKEEDISEKSKSKPATQEESKDETKPSDLAQEVSDVIEADFSKKLLIQFCHSISCLLPIVLQDKSNLADCEINYASSCIAKTLQL